MPFYHIPFQSGDNDVLKEMKRGAKREGGLSLTHTHSLPPAERKEAQPLSHALTSD
jgi:hypothetical protein